MHNNTPSTTKKRKLPLIISQLINTQKIENNKSKMLKNLFRKKNIIKPINLHMN